MFTIEQLSEQIDAMRFGGLTLDQFEDWFVSSSWGQHDTGVARDCVAAIESVFADLGDLNEHEASQVFANAIRPFAEPSIVTNRSNEPFPPSVARSNSENYSNAAPFSAAA